MFTWLRALGRWLEANVVLAPIVLTHIRDVKKFVLFGGPRELTPEQKRERGRRIRLACERLGVTYIKLAQFLTTRPDYVPPEYMEELEKLQDEVPPAPYEDVKRTVEEDLGPIDEVFDSFEEEAISGASIAQVHRATIDGKEVAVKIRRPGLERTVHADLKMLALVAPLAGGFLRFVGQRSHADTTEGIIGMFRENIVLEMDFEREKQIMDEIRTYVEEDDVEDVVIPRTIDSHCSGRVITMEYEPGVKIKEVAELQEMDVELEDVVDTTTEIYLRMPFEYEVFQADPHYGNIAVNEDGEVVIYDYGIALKVGEFDDERDSEELLEAFEALFVGIGLQDAEVVLNSMIEMDVIDPTDPDMDMETIQELADIMIRDVGGGGGISHDDIEKAEEMLMERMGDHPLHLHQDVILPFRTTVGVEGLCANVLPEYDFSSKLAEFFVEGGVEIDERFMQPVVGEYEEERERRRKKRRRRTNLARLLVGAGSLGVAGGAALWLGALNPWSVPAYVVAALGGLWIYNTTKDRGPLGPTQYATRYRMEQWEEGEQPPEDEDLEAVATSED